MEKHTKFVAYFRVSTDKQGKSGAGLDAQRNDVMRFTNGDVIAEFTDIESGAKSDRPEYRKAIAYAIQHDATLVIAKLDRLSREVREIFELRLVSLHPLYNNTYDYNQELFHMLLASEGLIEVLRCNALEGANNNLLENSPFPHHREELYPLRRTNRLVC